MKTRLQLSALALIAALAAPASHAGAFSVTPVRIYMAPKDRAVAITLVNEGDSDIALQAEVNQWTQASDGSDKLELTEDLVVAPPILKLAPRAKQVVRLALVAPRDASRQLTYRLIVREVPEAVGAKGAAIQLPIALVLSMPVFITPPAAKRQVTCSQVTPVREGYEASCANSGTAYGQVREMELRRGERVIARFEGSTYILPGATKAIRLAAQAADKAPGPAELRVTFDDPKPEVFSVEVR